jgi:ABC-type multidrug transport system ATPase subunit
MTTYQELLSYSAKLKRTDQRSCPNFKSIRRYLRRMFSSKNQYNDSLMTEDSVMFDASELVGNSADLYERVEEVIHMFGLESIANNKIGNPDESMSRGTRRLISIAQEVFNRTGLIFIEDPFHELYWSDAEQVLCHSLFFPSLSTYIYIYIQTFKHINTHIHT